MAIAATPAANAVGASKVYGSGETEVWALRNVTVEFEPGRFTAIMGPSGSGKSTLMQYMAGLDRLTSGEAYIAGQALSSLSDKSLSLLRRGKVGFVFQAYNLIPTLTARENITLPLDLAGGGSKDDQNWVEEVINTLGLRDRAHHRPNELSGRQQQRVAVARALASRPDTIFGDEPTGNLDSRTGAEILTFMRKAVDELTQTIVMVTHDPVAAAYSDRVLFLADGEILFGAVLGVMLGLFFGYAIIYALRDLGVSSFDVPVVQLVILVALAAIVGLVSSIVPAIRASRLNILEAIATD